MDITAISFVTLEGLKEFLAKCKETFALKSEIPKEYELPIAGGNTLGGVKIGENLNITSDGVLEAAIDSLLFQNEYHSGVTKISAFALVNRGANYYFPNVNDIAADALKNQLGFLAIGSWHFSIATRKKIKALTGYPKFGCADSSAVSVYEGKYIFDIGGVKMTVNKGSANVVFVDGESMTGDSVYIASSTDAPVMACDGVGLLVDTVNKAEDFTYDVVIPTSGTAVGLNFTDAAEDATINTLYFYGSSYKDPKIAELSGNSTSILCPADTELLAISYIKSGGDFYKYSGTIKGLSNFSLSECSTADNYIIKTDGSCSRPAASTIQALDNTYAGLTDIKAIWLKSCTSISTTNALNNCTGLVDVCLPACERIPNLTFSGCTSLKEVSLPVCTYIGTKAFYNCTSLEKISLPACTSIGQNAFSTCTSLTEIHFAAANKATIEASSYYSSKWGATNATIYFDL